MQILRHESKLRGWALRAREGVLFFVDHTAPVDKISVEIKAKEKNIVRRQRFLLLDAATVLVQLVFLLAIGALLGLIDWTGIYPPKGSGGWLLLVVLLLLSGGIYGLFVTGAKVLWSSRYSNTLFYYRKTVRGIRDFEGWFW